MSPSSVRATLVKMAFFSTVTMALGLVSDEVPGPRPKNPPPG
ncbi:MAG: hypothetical protein R2755_10035 [Acidimicrobiales bacterium]